METLQEIGMRCRTDKATYHNYCDFYQQYLPDRSFAGRLLEIGVMAGASARMWREYYPLADEIVCIDINLRVKYIEGVKLVEMNATDIQALCKLGSFDIIIDDGSHMTLDQQITFYWMYHHQLFKGGFYVMEDLHTSFIKNYINSSETTYNLLKKHAVIEYRGNNGNSISVIIPKI